MKFNFNVNITTLLLIVGVVVAVLLWRKEAHESGRWKDNYDASITSHKDYVSRVDGVIISYEKSIQFTESELRRVLKSDSIQRELVKKYRDLAAATTIITEWKHDTIEIEVPIFIQRDTTIAYQDKCFNVDLSFAKGKLSLMDMQIYNREDIISGKRKLGLFGSEYSIDVRNSNQCIIIVGVNSYKIVDKPKWYEHPILWGAAGIATGAYLQSRFK